MEVQTTVGKAMFLHMGTWLIPADRETSRKKRELRKWVRESISDTVEEAGMVFLPNGGFTPPIDETKYDLPVTIDLTTEQLNLIPAMFGRGVQWANFLTERQEDMLDELEQETQDWIKTEKSGRDLREAKKNMSPKERAKLAKELAEETKE